MNVFALYPPISSCASGSNTEMCVSLSTPTRSLRSAPSNAPGAAAKVRPERNAAQAAAP